MKRTIIYIVSILLCLALGIVGLLNKGETPKKVDTPNTEILNKTFYRYSGLNGQYEELTITNKAISYVGNDLNINDCKTYTYNKDTNIFKLDCNKTFRLVGYVDETLAINYNNTNYFFDIDKNGSFNSEFQRTFGMPISTYKTEGENMLNAKKIDLTKLNELLKSNINSHIYIKSDICDIDCTLFNKAFLQMGDINNLYVLNIEDITPNEYQELLKNYEGFLPSQDEYLTDKPSVITVGNNQVVNQIEIEIEGFNINKYDNFFTSSGGH